MADPAINDPVPRQAVTALLPMKAINPVGIASQARGVTEERPKAA